MKRSLRAPAQAAPGTARPAVLLVDDIDANLVALSAVLEGLECELVAAKSGNEALRLLLRRDFAVVLLDVQMPEMDGYEVAHHARHNPQTDQVPIIFLTATHNTEENVLRGYGSGAVDFLFKPINSSILRSKVRVFLELYSSHRQLAEAHVALEQRNADLRSLASAEAAMAEQFRAANEDLQRAYRELQDTQARLVQSAKMASLGELVAGVAHEINNPLAFSISHLDTARRTLSRLQPELAPRLSAVGAEQWSKVESRLGEMSVGLERIQELVVKLRTFSRLDEGELKHVSIRECVESVLMILKHRMKERVRVETRFGEPDVIECYPALSNQAMMNLISNSIDAIEGPGLVTVSTGAHDGQYAIEVSDTGAGIPEHLRERVLEPFFTTKPPGEGTGLGLSITFAIVRKHRGTLELAQRDGGGTTATIRIPTLAGEA